ncbi:MAG: hypothetical protein ACO3EY_07320 [Candidatus Nanopelagicales bacterium]|jgi:hypothetical protein
MQFDDLNESNVLLYAAKCYDKPNCIQSEFEEDYKKFRYIKRLLNRYRLTGVIKERLILNHINLTQNVFGISASTRILFLKTDKRDWSSLKTLLIFLSAMPNIVKGIRGSDIISSDIPLDENLVIILRDLINK